MRIGQGYDVHRFAPDRPLRLGGVDIPWHQGLEGHSDADVLCHAITDAILGAAGQGDIGQHFPPGDPAWKDADSIDLLGRAVEILERDGYQVVNVDATVIAERPKIGPYAGEMRERLAAVIGIAPTHVSIKATTNERMGWIGREEGIAAMAVALIDRMEDLDDLHARVRAGGA